MNAPIARLFVLVVVLFGLLIAFTSRWTVFEAESLEDKTANRRTLLEEQRVRRGVIRASDGTILARSVRGEAETFRRTYPAGGLFAHAIGYSYTNLGRAGLERFRNDELTGEHDQLTTLIDQLSGKDREGDDVQTTLSPGAQRAALQALGGQKGSVVAIEPDSGRIRVMASIPGFDPGELRSRRRFEALQRDDANSPLLNRATQAGYPPGSTFKVVTAAAALDSGRFRPETVLDASSPKEISGVPLENFDNKDFGPTDMTRALTFSVNTYWAQVGEKLGTRRMGEYMERFGFYAKPPLDYPSDQRASSGEYKGTDLLSPNSRLIDVGRMAIGQDKLRVTPLQMAQVAATVANDGVMMKPRLTEEVTDRDGRVVEEIEPDIASRVMKRSSARALGKMMTGVVREGTGTAAALQGIEVAGKTGTAERGGEVNQPWFIGFAPVSRPRIAIAVTVERSTGQGGTVAAPIAKQVLEALLR